jgi:hypothetical protein
VGPRASLDAVKKSEIFYTRRESNRISRSFSLTLSLYSDGANFDLLCLRVLLRVMPPLVSQSPFRIVFQSSHPRFVASLVLTGLCVSCVCRVIFLAGVVQRQFLYLSLIYFLDWER